MSGFHAARRQAGGGNASASGTTGSGAHSIVVISERGSRLRWRAGTHDAGQHLLSVGPAPGAVAAADLTRDHCGADGLLGPPVGGVDRRVAQEEEHRREFVGQVLGEALGVGQRRRGVDQPAEPGGEPTAGRRQTVLTDFARVRAGPQGETVLQDRLHRARPGAVGMSGLQVLAPSQEVRQARLMRRLLEAAIGHPTVPHQHAGEVGAEHRRRIGEPPAVADGVDRRLRSGERPQPVEDRVHPPARLIRRDHRTLADLLAQRRIRGRRRVGGAVQQLDEAALGHRQSELRPQNADGPSPAACPARCATRRPARRRSGPVERQPPPTRRRSAGRAGPARAADTASSGPPRCRSAARGDAPRAALPDTATPHGPARPRRRSPDSSSGPAPRASRQPVSAAVGAHASRTPPRLAARDARRVPADGPWRRGPLVGGRRAAPPRAPSPDARCGASSDPAPRSASPCLVRGARCARPEGLAEAQDPSNPRGHRSCAPYFTYRHTPAVPAYLFVDFLATTR